MKHESGRIFPPGSPGSTSEIAGVEISWTFGVVFNIDMLLIAISMSSLKEQGKRGIKTFACGHRLVPIQIHVENTRVVEAPFERSMYEG